MKKLSLVTACIWLLPLLAASPSLGDAVKQNLDPAGVKLYTDPVSGIQFTHVTGGCYKMGDTFGDGADNEKPPHEVCVADFDISINKVTQENWKRVMGGNPSHFKTCGDECPVESVSWNDVQDFIAKLNKQGGKEFRLPSEAEWEYACRSGGKDEKYCGSNDVMAVAWYFSTSGEHPQAVGRKKANGLGLYDMSGNVWEWVSDWYDEKYSTIKDNPQGPSSGTGRVIKGGGWYMLPRNVRASVRSSLPPDEHADDVGFRLVFTTQ